MYQDDDEADKDDPEDLLFLDHVISDISVVLRETSFTISASTGKLVSVESAIERVVSLSTIEISEITR